MADYQEVIDAMKAGFDSAVFGKEKTEASKVPFHRSVKVLVTKTSIPPLKKRHLPYSA